MRTLFFGFIGGLIVFILVTIFGFTQFQLWQIIGIIVLFFIIIFWYVLQKAK